MYCKKVLALGKETFNFKQDLQVILVGVPSATSNAAAAEHHPGRSPFRSPIFPLCIQCNILSKFFGSALWLGSKARPCGTASILCATLTNLYTVVMKIRPHCPESMDARGSLPVEAPGTEVFSTVAREH